jgi:Fur family ferric uptake transcriptional regulator
MNTVMVIIPIKMMQPERQSGGARLPQPRGTKIRSTRQSATVVEVMAGMPAFRGAREIRDAVRRAGLEVGVATVYRHLRVLVEQGSVDTIRGPGGEALYRLRRGVFTHYLTCRECERSIEVDGHEIWDWAQRAASRAGFTLTWHAVELRGLCPAHAAPADPGADSE